VGTVHFDLLETLRWTPEEGFFLLDRHLRRLQNSSRYFGFACSLDSVREALAAAVRSSDQPLRVRLLLSESGVARTEQSTLAPAVGIVRLELAATPIDPADPFLFHKTTNRAQYDRPCRFDDVVLWNPAREVTETTIANIVVDVGGRLVTPPVECGLLAGTMRAELLEVGEISEQVVPIDELCRAPRLWVVNSVRGWRPARIELAGS
jgi:para-aminobenzoate synthetase/4-amino-4-deoxychorismate lyase